MSNSAATADSRINQRIFETSLDLILVVDRQGYFVRVSPSCERILGYAAHEMLGRNAREFLVEEDLEHTRQEMRLARRNRESRNFDCRYVHKDGHVVPISWKGVWLESDGLYFFIGRDMTERYEMERRQTQSQRLEAIGQLTGGIAHDFNNLLSVILGNLELAKRRLDDDSEAGRRLERVEQAALRGATLTAQLLAFARQQPLSARVFDMNASVEGTMTLLQRTLGDGVEIESRLAPDLWKTLADPTQFESALVNLALNARDAMNGDGALVVETGNVRIDGPVRVHGTDIPPGDYCALSVSDTGTGMDPDTAAHVFEPFFTTKPTGKGTGMGLSMVYGFASQSSGGVRIYSEVGVGTTVRIYLPRASADADAIEARGSSVIDAGELARGETILVAEDDTDVREVVVAQLKDLGYRVIIAPDGEAALNVLQSGEAVDLLFTDLTMPGGLNGTELVEAARSLRPGLKALLTSGFALAGSIGGDNVHGRLPLLVKPYRRSELAARIRAVLDS